MRWRLNPRALWPIFAVLLGAGAYGETRIWTDATGKHKIEAELVEFGDGEITLRNSAGKTKVIAIEDLCAADREIANRLVQELFLSRLSAEQRTAFKSMIKLGGGANIDPFIVQLGGKKITDAVLVHLAALADVIEGLELHQTSVTNAGMGKLSEQLADAPGPPGEPRGARCRSARLFRQRASAPAGLKKTRVPRVPRVRRDQGIKGSPVALTHLKSLPNLKALTIGGEASDDWWLQLKGLTKLKDLKLSGTAITDAGLLKLHNLKSLREISLGGTKVTKAGKAKLRAALPACAVW